MLNHNYTPDLVLMDLNLPLINGLEVSRRVLKRRPELKIIILSTYHCAKSLDELLTIGVSGYILKNTCGERLILNIRKIVKGEIYFDNPCHSLKHINAMMENEFGERYHLTGRELEILRCIKNELSNAAIAEKLFISIATVETHRKHIVHKLGVKSIASMVRFAIEHGI
jgi:DNA-binding NarL/FixJ family response regulator